MKKRVALLLVISVLFSGLSVIAADTTYTIKTAQDFLNIRNNPDATYILAADIVLPSNYSPMEFSGSLIGDNETELRSITVDISKTGSAKDNGAALFSVFRGKGTIKNICLKGSVTGGSYVAGFIAQCATGSGAIISNLINEAVIRAEGSTVGGIVAKADANLQVTDVCNRGNVYGVSDVGGICGSSSTNTFYLCRNYGNVTASGNYCGGITGNNYAIHNYCYNSGNITGNSYVGGIVGLAIGNRDATYLYNTGEIASKLKTNGNESGGIIGGVYSVATSRVNIKYAVSVTAPQNVSGEYSPIYPSYTPVSDTNYVKAESCFYYSKELKDDGKEGTEAVNDENYTLISNLLNDIDSKFKAIQTANNAYWQDEILDKLNSRVALFVGNNKAVIIKDGKSETVRIDSESVDVVPVIKSSVTVVPVGFVARALDAEVSWVPENRTVEISGNGKNVIISIGSDKAVINGEPHTLAYPAYIENGRTMIPLRSVSEMLGKKVFWDSSGLILLSDNEISPSREYVEAAIGIWLISPHDVTGRMKYAEPGDTLIIADGVYNNVSIDIDFKATEKAPVVIKAQTPGGVELRGESHITLTGEYITVKDLYFNECVREAANTFHFYKAKNCRLTGCYFYKCGATINPMTRMIAITGGSAYNRIDHNVVERAQAMAISLEMDYSYTFEESNHDNAIDNNYFLDIRQVGKEFPGYSNGLEVVQLGASWGSPYKLNNVIEYNRFEQIYGDGGEGICAKTSGNTVRYNTFVNSIMSGLSGRYGDDNVYEGNFLFNVKSGITTYGHGHLIKNNYIYSPMRDGFRTYSCPGDSYGIEGDYQAVHDSTVEGNIYLYPPYAGIMLGDRYNSDNGYINVPTDITFKDNTFFMNKGKVLRDFASFNISYENNSVTLSGGADMGDAGEGFTEKENKLVFDGEIYLPEDRLDFDKTGLISFEEAGPENRWWEPLLRCEHHYYYDEEPETSPVKITPSVSSVVINTEKGYNLKALTVTAEYDAPELYSGSFDSISFESLSFDVSGGFKINGSMLTASEEGSGILTVIYKGVSCKVSLKAVKSKGSSISDGFESLDSTYVKNSSQVWEIADGRLENTSGGSGMIINYAAELEGDYELSCDVSLKKKDDTTAVSGGIVIGYTEEPEISYTSVRFAEEGETTGGIYNCDWYWSERKSETTVFAQADKPFNVVLRKIGNDLIVITDGVVSGIYENGKNLNGKFGFITYGNIMSVDNVKVTPISEPEKPSVASMEMFVQRIDTTTVNVGIENTAEGAAYYRIFRQGTPVYDCNEPTYFTDILVRIGKEYRYAVKAYDEYGQVIAEGNIANTLDEAESNEFFEITNLYLKRGTKEVPYRTNVIRSKNRGLNEGIWAFFDRNYTIDKMPEYLKDAGYIKTANGDKSNEEFLSEGDDWMKFDINRSATVYVLMFHIFDTPEWLKDWTVINNPGFEISGNPIPQIMYSKHFNVEEGKTTTVTLGGFKFVNVMYLVFVKPDDMPEYVEMKKINPSVA